MGGVAQPNHEHVEDRMSCRLWDGWAGTACRGPFAEGGALNEIEKVCNIRSWGTYVQKDVRI